MIDETIPNYKIVEKIGGGGMGVVYKAQDEKLDRIVALKFLPSHLLFDKEAENRFISEAKTASSFDHPNICTIYDIDRTDNDQLYIAMAWYNGKTLKREIEDGPISTSNFIEYSLQIAQGLERAHEAGITHRDIKPANIIITNRGELKILDFGLAKTLHDSDLTKMGMTMGTATYMSPEQAKGTEINHQSDIWSLGVVMYQMLTGVVPFKGGYEQAIIYSILNEEPEPITKYAENCSSTLIKIVNKCLEKDPTNRYQSITKLIEDIELYQLDPDYGFTTKPIKHQLGLNSKKKLKNRLALFALIFTVMIITFISSPGWQNLKELVGLSFPLKERHLLILPLTNIGGDESRQVFCDGLMEILSSKLTQIEKFKGSLWIVPSSEVISNNVKSPNDAHKIYGVNYAVTGSLQFTNELFRLTLNLVDAVSLRQLNSSVLDINVTDISSLQDQAVIKLLEMLHIELEPELRDIIKEGGTSKPDAYEYYVEGRGYLQRYENIENIDEAINSFNRSTKSDDHYSLAYAGLGESYWRKFEVTKNTGLVEKAIKACEQAFRIDSLLVPINVTLGMIYSGTGRYNDAVNQFNRAISKDPSNASAHRGLAKSYILLKRNEEAESTFKKAIKLKPAYWAGYNDLGVFYFSNEDYEEAIEQFKMVIELTPDNYRGYNNLGGIYYMLERWDDARDMFEQSLSIKESYNIYSNLGTLYYIERNFEKAAKTYEKALQLNDKDYLTWGNLAAAYNGLSNKKNEVFNTYNHAILIAEGQLKINPNNVDVISNLASYYAEVGEENKSLNFLKKSLIIAPENAGVIYRAASTYEKLGERELALNSLVDAIERGYSRSEIENQYELQALIADQRYKKLVENVSDQ